MLASNPPESSALFVVAAALIRGDNRVLVQQRSAGKHHGGLWEFPGGKIEPGETPEEALSRELEEELGIKVRTDDLLPVTFASAPAGARRIVLLLFRTHRWLGEPRAIESAAIRWMAPAALRELQMPPADLPFIDVLEQLGSGLTQQG